MFCSNCGKQIPDGSAFCPECGATLGGAQAAPQGAAMQNFQQGFNNFQNAVKGADYSDVFNMNRTGNKMNFVGFGAALLMLIFLFLPMYHITAKVSAMGESEKTSESFNIFQCGGFAIFVAIVLILVIIATAFFSFIKMDTPILIAGLVATVLMLILTILFIAGAVTLTKDGDSMKAKDAIDMMKQAGAYAAMFGGKLKISAGGTFSFIMLWIATLGTVFAGICRKFIPALR